MHADIASDPNLLRRYEGVVRTTASMTVERCEEEFEDICQVFRIKVWKALVSFDASRLKSEDADSMGRTALDRYVFACIKNQQKDLEKKVKRAHRISYIEDMNETFEAGFLGVSDDLIFTAVEEVAPLIPSTLDARERQIVTLLYLDFDNGEIGQQLGIRRERVAKIIREIRQKLADWAPPGWQPSKPVLTSVPRPEPVPIAA
jgi:RNA polymerase sigma factor (sigma-70 family)